jgi:hypothetical protein
MMTPGAGLQYGAVGAEVRIATKACDNAIKVFFFCCWLRTYKQTTQALGTAQQQRSAGS